MSSLIGNNIKVSVFGQSHSAAIGVNVDGLPSGFEIDTQELSEFMARRAPGKAPYATARSEADAPEFVSGLVGNTTCGAPLCAIIRNTNTRSGDYDNLRDCPRPAHADYPANVRYKGFQDVAGGGHFSGRLTAPLCIAGGICKQILRKQYNVDICAHILRIGEVADKKFDPVNVGASDFVYGGDFPTLDLAAGEKMKEIIATARADGDSVGGIIECAVVGMPVGVGDPMFDGVENRLAVALFGIPAVKGVQFGAGFDVADMRGSQNNDPYTVKDGKIVTTTNNAGGILGGITTGMPVVFSLAVKPTPSIAKEQQSVSISDMCDKKLVINGRHDPCILPRAVPVVEAVSAIVMLDMLLSSDKK